MKRAEAAQLFSRENAFRWVLFRKFIEEEGKNSKEVVWEECCSNLVILQLSSWENLLISSELILSWRLVFDLLHLVPSQGDQSKLGGPEKSLSERSPGIGREERPPIAVVVHNIKTGFSFISLCLSEFRWLYVTIDLSLSIQLVSVKLVSWMVAVKLVSSTMFFHIWCHQIVL